MTHQEKKELIFQLRRETGWGLMDCKQALEETDYCMPVAKQWLVKNMTNKHILYSTKEEDDKIIYREACGIINQLYDLAAVPVVKRQEINDTADKYLQEQLKRLIDEFHVPKKETSAIDISKIVCHFHEFHLVAKPTQGRCIICDCIL